MKINELRKLSDEKLKEKLKDLKLELLKERGNVEMGGNIKNPGKIKVMKRDIARIMTLKKERESKK